MRLHELLVLLSILSPSAGKGDDDSKGSIEVGGFMSPEDFDYCYNALSASDTNGDNEVNSQEYVNFAVQMVPEGSLDGVDSFSNLPTEFQAAFLGTACLCRDPTFGGNKNDPLCCKGDNAHIRVPPLPPDQQSFEDRLYMYAACSYTSSAADAAFTPAPTTTMAPTASVAPTIPPTAVPTVTMAPSTSTPPPTPLTEAPTPASSDTPTEAPFVTPQPTPAPSTSPSNPPLFPNLLPASVSYQISVVNGKTDLTPIMVEDYLMDLKRAMNILGPQVVQETFGSSRLRRRLKVTYKGSDAEVLSNFTCPSSTPSTSLCQNINATTSIDVVDEPQPEEMVSQYETALEQAIQQGRLQSALTDVNPQSPASVLTATSTQAGGGLSPGATAGIVIAVIVVLGGIGFAIRKANEEKPETKEPYEAYEKENDSAEDLDERYKLAGRTDDAASIDSTEVYTQGQPPTTTTAAVIATSAAGAVAAATVASTGKLGASEPDYGRASRKAAVETMAAGEDIVAEPEMDINTDSSSNAGSSGWSSSAGISSLNTGSIDDSMDAAAAAGATLAAIGATSALSKKVESDTSKSALDKPPPAAAAAADVQPETSRSQLDALIEAGDWAAVGATAALLAAASDSQSENSRSETGSSTQPREAGRSMDAMRAAELDNLVDAGDWEGVVLAAAKFEAAESSASSRSSMDGESVDTGTQGTGTAATPSVGTTVSESPSKVQRRSEIRKEVEALVRRVVPEEIDNVDEMMNQFKGREEELVETLRTMQERSVAQKARTAGQKAAKTEARRSVQRGVVPGVDPSTVAALSSSGVGGDLATEATSADNAGGAAVTSGVVAAVAAATAVLNEEDKSQASVGDRPADVEPNQRRSALEDAIEAGDWEAVGEAAAMMSDVSVATASTGEIDRLADAMSLGSSSASAGLSGGRRRLQLEGLDEERAMALDSMIDKGDWTGIVEATKQFKDADKKKKSARSREEEEALAQAEAWMKIAEESKAAGSQDAGASDAAEWAIQRSLDQLKKKEQEQQKGKKDGDDDEEEV